ncbi:hypothetical protein P692DRAFT_201887830 [Suillus brevipes Sb2]|jgi:4-nitrophenyl phosphatase|nr:hypothetical protein P692DRAFT_201887830 [Suillus brevipes Sb2]
MAGIEEELREDQPTTTQIHSLTWALTQDPEDCTLEPFSLSSSSLYLDVQAVLCGLDLSVNYTELPNAFQHLT